MATNTLFNPLVALNEHICNKIDIIDVGSNFYEAKCAKWVWEGSTLTVNNINQTVKKVVGNKIYVDTAIPNPYSVFIQKISQIYENISIIEVLKLLEVDGYNPFIANQLVNFDEFRKQYEIIIAFPYLELSHATSYIAKCVEYLYHLADANRFVSEITISEYNNVRVYPYYSSDFNEAIAVKFNALYAAVTARFDVFV